MKFLKGSYFKNYITDEEKVIPNYCRLFVIFTLIEERVKFHITLFKKNNFKKRKSRQKVEKDCKLFRLVFLNSTIVFNCIFAYLSVISSISVSL